MEYLKGVGPQRGDLLKKELGIFLFNDLLHHFPYRHIDKTKILKIIDLNPAIEFAQLQGTLLYSEVTGEKAGKRLIAYIKDGTGTMELTWFKGITWVQKLLREGEQYTVFGRLSFFMGKPQIVHPELEILGDPGNGAKNYLEPVYATTEKLKARGLGARQIGKLVFSLLQLIKQADLPENIPEQVLLKA
ncbi:MAG TPA: OB-fold nucleic acid binding domain-containing protein, partial [Flavisolibacter sp.]|nr:OB-fold nucleic acid binding domain-containing protein [Flavisolibacter sp.]